MNVGFSTLGCPEWSLEHAVDMAEELAYDGIELRLLDGTIVTPNMRHMHRDRVRRAAQRTTLQTLASSVRLAGPEPDQTVTDLFAMIGLAADWRIPVIRVFGGRLAEGESRAEAVRSAARVVSEVLAETSVDDVGIALETHDDFSASAHVAELLEAVGHPRFTAIWDTQHTWRAGDAPSEAWRNLAPYVTEIQLKDGRPDGDRWRQTQLGDGEIPARDCLDHALSDGYDGWIVVEWEKHWQPALDDPEVALPAHRGTIASWLT